MSPNTEHAMHVTKEEVNNWTSSLRDFLGLTTEREKYEARDRDSDGKTKTTESHAFNFFVAKKREGDVPPESLYENGRTQREQMDHNAYDPLRQAMSSDLTKEHREYEARMLATDGAATKPESFHFHEGKKSKLDAADNFHVNQEDLDSFSKRIRDWLGLTKAREDYNLRLPEGTGHTETEAFEFAYTNERARLRAEKGEGMQAEVSYTITKKDQQLYMTGLREANHAELARANAEYQERERDDQGRVVGTVATAPVFHESNNTRRASLEPSAPDYNISKEDTQNYMNGLRSATHAELEHANQEYQMRERDDQGRVVSTVPVAPETHDSAGYHTTLEPAYHNTVGTSDLDYYNAHAKEMRSEEARRASLEWSRRVEAGQLHTHAQGPRASIESPRTPSKPAKSIQSPSGLKPRQSQNRSSRSSSSPSPKSLSDL